MTYSTFSVERENNVAVFAVCARRLTAANQNPVKRAMRTLLRESEFTVVDIAQIDCLDSRTLGAFIEWIKIAGELGRTLVFCGLDRPKRAVLELTRFHEVVDVFNDRAQALAFLSAAARSGLSASADSIRHEAKPSGKLVRAATGANA